MKEDDISVRDISSATNESQRYVYRMLETPKKRVQEKYAKKLSEMQKNEAISCYYDEEVSYSLPDIKYAGVRFMGMTLKEAYYTNYLMKCQSDRKMSLASFCSLKPAKIRTIQQTPLRGCKCDYCQNLGIVREKMIGIGFKCIPKNHACSIEATWCSFRNQTKCLHSSSEVDKLPMIEESSQECDENEHKNCDVKGDVN